MKFAQNLADFGTLAELREGLAELERAKAKQQAAEAADRQAAAEADRLARAEAERAALLADLAEKEEAWAGIVARYEAAIDEIQNCTSAMAELNGWQSRNGSRLTDAGIGVKMASTPKIQQIARYRLWG